MKENNDISDEQKKMEDELKKLEEENRKARIKKEIDRLGKLFSKVDAKRKKAVNSLIENAAFMSVTLDDLQMQINRNGAVSEYQNGENQWGTKKSPQIEIYNSMIKNHMSILKQLTDLMPEPEIKQEKQKPDAFEIIMGRGKNV